MLETAQAVIRIALALVFIGMGSSHFVPAVKRTMAAMIPPRLRWTGALNPRSLVAVTGVLEIAGGVGLLVPATTVAAGICLVLLLAAVFPANAYAASRPERFGRVAVPLMPRLLGQAALAALILFAVWPL